MKANNKSYITISKLDMRNAIGSNIELEEATNIIVEDNMITTVSGGGGHGIMIDGITGFACDGVVRNNYISTDDDCIWFYNCTDLTAIKMYGNVCVDSGDDCLDLRASGVTTGDYYIYGVTTDGTTEVTALSLGVATLVADVITPSQNNSSGNFSRN